MRIILLSLIVFFYGSIKAQVGINTISPKASLDIEVSNRALPDETDGILIPRVDEFAVLAPGSDQDGMLVFVTGNGSPEKGFYYWDNVASSWVPLNKQRHYIGELYGGGIVYYVDNDGQHGLIASLSDLDGGMGIEWYNGSYTTTAANDYYDGSNNTSMILSSQGAGAYAAKLCDDFADGGFTDWYLPSCIELREMNNAIVAINNVLSNDGNASTTEIYPEYVTPTFGRYWSSTEIDSNMAWYYSFSFSGNDAAGKSTTCRVRAVRAF